LDRTPGPAPTIAIERLFGAIVAQKSQKCSNFGAKKAKKIVARRHGLLV